jgi:hypothetical protein
MIGAIQCISLGIACVALPVSARALRLHQHGLRVVGADAHDNTHHNTYNISAATNLSSGRKDVPSVFVAILMKRDSPKEQRQALRYMWRDVDAGSSSVCSQFVFCGGIRDANQELRSESKLFGDILFLNC